MGGCGTHCRCTGDASGTKDESCAVPKGSIALDKNGKCPCGKSADECCHKTILKNATVDENPALHELCKPHGKQHLCG